MVKIPYFDDADLFYDELGEADGGPPEERATDVLAIFQTLTPKDREADARHVYAYYRDFREAVGGEDWMDKEMGVPESPVDIWNHVQPDTVTVQLGASDDELHVYIHARCDWEPEHGLQMVWQDGIRLVKVSGIDGNPSNGSFWDGDVIYSGQSREFTTFRDPES